MRHTLHLIRAPPDMRLHLLPCALKRVRSPRPTALALKRNPDFNFDADCSVLDVRIWAAPLPRGSVVEDVAFSGRSFNNSPSSKLL